LTHRFAMSGCFANMKRFCFSEVNGNVTTSLERGFSPTARNASRSLELSQTCSPFSKPVQSRVSASPSLVSRSLARCSKPRQSLTLHRLPGLNYAQELEVSLFRLARAVTRILRQVSVPSIGPACLNSMRRIHCTTSESYAK
jgi:hypothetical protein